MSFKMPNRLEIVKDVYLCAIIYVCLQKYNIHSNMEIVSE
ncbi:hypothetical protein D1BOALGB6SA_2039 [Olavius sp. associated proteobacterium Delta 1]|nr:hypothetical protein D1BOALGB6SA_2039 [Olavius sp. associated proteobacterium Delta 1]